MEGKTYALIFTMADGSKMRVEFTAPQGPKGIDVQKISIREA